VAVEVCELWHGCTPERCSGTGFLVMYHGTLFRVV
jgi:hypothetical protein